jgi:type III pantothenate kinase
MIILLDIGNTNTHVGLGNSHRVIRQLNIPTSAWKRGNANQLLKQFATKVTLEGASLCSVVPQVTHFATRTIKQLFDLPCLQLTAATLKGVGLDYPKPNTIGADRLANVVAVRHHFGTPSVAIDFGTAVTIDVVNQLGNFVGGVIAPGLAAMTDYLHEKTALLPKIHVRRTKAVIGKSTEQAMMIGTVHGYQGLIRALLQDIKRELTTRRLPVVATGGYAQLMAESLPEITAVEPSLTLEGIRLVWHAHRQEGNTPD